MTRRLHSLTGLIVALLIIGLWAASLIVWFSMDLASIHPAWILAGITWQTFLHTGLFITAHDAMHGAVFPLDRRINEIIGHLAVRLYALFSFRKLREKHHEHHAHPATNRDPDFHAEGSRRFCTWYARFMAEYLGVGQLLAMAIAYNVLLHVAGVGAWNLNLLWVLPALLSTLQLFYFGTYLPHRRPPGGYTDEHRATSSGLGPVLSLLSCYHFGYHWEHHARPHVPWWRLPALRADFRDSPDPEFS